MDFIFHYYLFEKFFVSCFCHFCDRIVVWAFFEIQRRIIKLLDLPWGLWKDELLFTLFSHSLRKSTLISTISPKNVHNCVIMIKIIIIFFSYNNPAHLMNKIILYSVHKHGRCDVTWKLRIDFVSCQASGFLIRNVTFSFFSRKDNFTFKCHRSNGAGTNVQDIYAVSKTRPM